MPFFLRFCWLLTAGMLLLSAPAARAQSGAVGYGDWQLHLPTNRALSLADAGGQVYVATEDALLLFDKELNTTRLLSRRDGLHDVGARVVAYDSVTQSVVVAYRNTNLDVVRPDGSVRNLTDILRKQLTGENTIYSISFHARKAYLAASFGLVVLDLDRLEIRDTYSNIGPGGTAVRVYNSTVLHDSLYVATSAGLLRGRLTDNLLDYRNWQTDPNGQYRASDPYRGLTTYRGEVYAGLRDENILRFTGREWVRLEPARAQRYVQLVASRAGLLVVSEEQLTLLKPDGTSQPLSDPLLTRPQAARLGADGRLFVADYRRGLLVAPAVGQPFASYVGNAPATASAFSLLPDATGRTTVFTGGFSERYLQADKYEGFYEFKDGRWTNINATQLPDPTQYPNPKDLVRGVRLPNGKLYVASYGNGLLEWEGPGKFRVFNIDSELPNPLISSIPGNPNYTRLLDVALSSKGEVWMTSRHPEVPNQPGLHIFSPADSRWRSVPYFPGADGLDRLVLDDFDVAWISRARRDGLGLVAVDESGNYRAFTQSSGGLPKDGDNLYDVVKDRNGAIWVATSKGVAVYDDPSLVFTADNPGFRTPVVRRGSGANFPTLFTELVRCIAVDGGNRKWFGTDAGLWLFNETADEPLLHFTTANSPLPSNKIIDVAVNDKTGEVFVATEAGLVAYRGSATVTTGKPSCARVYPNPVPRNFSGQVGIAGLANGASVKITDVNGILVYQTRASGGTVVWNLNDIRGRRVQAGVYLVLTADANGENGCLSKIAVVEP